MEDVDYTEQDLRTLVTKIRERAQCIVGNADWDGAALHPTSGYGADNIREDAHPIHKLAVELSKAIIR